MLTFTVDADPAMGLSDAAVSWLVNAHIPAQFNKAMALVREERTEFGRPFDANLRTTLMGRVHIKLHSSDWEYSPGLWVAGVYLISGGPQLPEDGANWVDLIEASWKHEWDLGWDTLEHEFAHFIEYRHEGNPATHQTDWTNIGHGTKSDPYLQAMNSKIMRAYPPTQGYFPGLLPSSAQRASLMSAAEGEGKFFRGCAL